MASSTTMLFELGSLTVKVVQTAKHVAAPKPRMRVRDGEGHPVEMTIEGMPEAPMRVERDFAVTIVSNAGTANATLSERDFAELVESLSRVLPRVGPVIGY